MSTLRKLGTPVAICCADIHLSSKPPPARAGEPDWFAAMKRPLDEIRQLAAALRVPVLCAGDIFDRWNSPPELINFAIDNLPDMIAIPGQHDLPMHSLDHVGMSAYRTLELALHGVIETPSPKGAWNGDKQSPSIYGFPFGVNVFPRLGEDESALSIALVHRYVWISGHSYPNAPDEFKLAGRLCRDIEGYDVVVFGDNHDGFGIKVKNTTVFNCGTLIRRKSDEAGYRPRVGVIYANGHVEPYYLNTSQDVFDPMPSMPEEVMASPLMRQVMSELKNLTAASLDFASAVMRIMDRPETPPALKAAVLEVLERAR